MVMSSAVRNAIANGGLPANVKNTKPIVNNTAKVLDVMFVLPSGCVL